MPMNMRVRKIATEWGIDLTNEQAGASLANTEWEARRGHTFDKDPGGNWSTLWHRHTDGYVHDFGPDNHTGWVLTWQGDWPRAAATSFTGSAPSEITRAFAAGELAAARPLTDLFIDEATDVYFECPLETVSLRQLALDGYAVFELAKEFEESDWRGTESLLRLQDERGLVRRDLETMDIHWHL
jgi:hypothetical protein